MRNFIFTGDTHAHVFDRVVAAKRMIRDRNLINGNVMFILGDAGILWDVDSWKTVDYIERYMVSHFPDLELLMVPGNHENYDMIEQLEEIDRYGGRMRRVAANIYFMITGEVYVIDGKVFACYGGALSIDKEQRKLGKTYWAQEIPTMADFNKFVDNMDKHGMVCDYLLTHTTAVSEIVKFDMYPFTGKLEDQAARDIMRIKQNIEIREHHYFGHFHLNKTVDELNSTCLYKNLILEEFVE